MPFKLILKHTGETAAAPETYVFDQERITIGRGGDNDLPLPDPKRVISKEHAAIDQRGTALFVTDLGSKNFTYLGDERLTAQQPREIPPGQTVHIGDYALSAETVPADLPARGAFADDRTMFDVGFVNPFEDGAKLLATALRDLHKHYEREAPSRRDDALLEALREALDGDGEQALGLAARLVGGREADRTPSQPPPMRDASLPSPPVGVPEAAAEPLSGAAFPGSSSARRAGAGSGGEGAAPRAPSQRVDEVLGESLHALSQLLTVPWHFRHEFIGQTIMQTEESAALYEGETALRRHLLDPAVPDAEAAERIGHFREATEEVVRHLVALLDGYRASAQEGAKRLLDQLHPDALLEEVERQSIVFRLLPPLAKAEVLDRLRDQLQEMRAEDWVSLEQRTYRPAFIKAYLARMTSSR